MSIYLAIVVFFLTIFLVISKNYKGQVILMVISLFGNMFYYDIFGSRLLLFHTIPILTLPLYILKKNKARNQIIFGIKLEYLILVIGGIIFGFIYPWQDNSSTRIWSQLAGGRTIVALIRIFLEILTLLYSFWIFSTKKVPEKFILKLLSVLLIVCSTFSFLDLILDHELWKILFQNASYSQILKGRLIGWCHEPRSFGRLILMPWFILLIYAKNNAQVRFIRPALMFGFVAIIATLSFSTYLLLILGLTVVFLKSILFMKVGRSTPMLIVVTTMLIAGYSYISSTAYFDTGLTDRYELLTNGKKGFRMKGEPKFFTSFEVFDRAALNFFYNDIKYIYFGAGPNLIGIPSSKYLDESAINTFNGTLIGIPGIGIINHISRAGLFGLFLYCLTFVNMYRYARKSNNRAIADLCAVSVSLYLLVSSPWIYFLAGFMIAQSERKLNKHI